MAETTTQQPAESPKKGKAKSPKKGAKAAKAVAAHPPTAQMVNAAIKALNEKGGSSLQAIKKYISAQYKIDASKASTYIKKYLKSAVSGGKLVQTKGTGASGSFKFPSKDQPAKKPKAKKAKKVVVVKTVTPKKAAPKKKPVAKKAKAGKSPAKPKPKKLKVTTAKPKKAPAKKPAKRTSPKKK